MARDDSAIPDREKMQFEFYKHLTTLGFAGAVLDLALLGLVEPPAKPFLGASVLALTFGASIALWAMWAISHLGVIRFSRLEFISFVSIVCGTFFIVLSLLFSVNWKEFSKQFEKQGGQPAKTAPKSPSKTPSKAPRAGRP